MPAQITDDDRCVSSSTTRVCSIRTYKHDHTIIWGSVSPSALQIEVKAPVHCGTVFVGDDRGIISVMGASWTGSHTARILTPQNRHKKPTTVRLLAANAGAYWMYSMYIFSWSGHIFIPIPIPIINRGGIGVELLFLTTSPLHQCSFI